MNQILVTEKVYVTPELRRKRKVYKIQFFLSVFLVCLLFSYYIYAEYDREKSEEVSQEILVGIRSGNSTSKTGSLSNSKTKNTTVDTTVRTSNDVMIIAIEDDIEPEIEQQVTQQEVVEEQEEIVTQDYTARSGVTYTIESYLRIPSLDIDYPILSDTSEDLLKISINKYWGPAPNQVGNYCVVGHNYKNKKMFGRLSEIVNGDLIELEDMTGNVVTYSVYDKYTVDPEDTSCTSQLTNGKKELTLITCKEYGTKRLVVKAKEVR